MRRASMGEAKRWRLAVAAVLVVACGDAEPVDGELDGPCYPNQTCNEALVCLEDVCVEAEVGGTGADGDWAPMDWAPMDWAPMDSAPMDSAPMDAGEQGGDTGGDSTPADDVMDDPMPGTSTSPGDGGNGATTSTTSTTSTSAGDGDAGDDAGGCAPAACTTNATKMASCYPMLDVDWYAECLEIYDICDIGGSCFDGVPEVIACLNTTPCEDVVDGACVGLRNSC